MHPYAAEVNKPPVSIELHEYEKRPTAITIGRGKKQSDGAVSRFPDFFTIFYRQMKMLRNRSPKVHGERFLYLN